MTAGSPDPADPPPSALRHDALFYEDVDQFVTSLSPFLAAGVEAGERVVVAVPVEKVRPLTGALGRAADQITFLDMRVVGRNPARLTSTWHRFALDAQAAGLPLRGVGEPVWPERTRAELIECDVHECLLNSALQHTSTWLVCPYDVATLDAAVAVAARRCHDAVHAAGPIGADRRALSGRHGAHGDALGAPLDPPPESIQSAEVRMDRLRSLRDVVRCQAADAGLDAQHCEDLVLAVSELAGNTLRHTRGEGTLAWWTTASDPPALVFEVRDAGWIGDPLVGRRHPTVEQHGGRGLWLVNQLCDLVQVRSNSHGTVVRASMYLPAHAPARQLSPAL